MRISTLLDHIESRHLALPEFQGGFGWSRDEVRGLFDSFYRRPPFGGLLVWKPEQLPRDWTTDTLWEKHASLPFNPDLATAFFRAGMIESWGQGIQRIVTACKTAGIPAPMVRIKATGLWMEFRLPRPKQPRVTSVKTGGKTRKKTSVKTSVKTREETSVKILELFRRNPEMSLAEVADKIGRSLRAVEMASAKLKDSGKLRRVGPARGGRWEVLK